MKTSSSRMKSAMPNLTTGKTLRSVTKGLTENSADTYLTWIVMITFVALAQSVQYAFATGQIYLVYIVLGAMVSGDILLIKGTMLASKAWGSGKKVFRDFLIDFTRRLTWRVKIYAHQHKVPVTLGTINLRLGRDESKAKPVVKKKKKSKEKKEETPPPTPPAVPVAPDSAPAVAEVTAPAEDSEKPREETLAEYVLKSTASVEPKKRETIMNVLWNEISKFDKLAENVEDVKVFEYPCEECDLQDGRPPFTRFLLLARDEPSSFRDDITSRFGYEMEMDVIYTHLIYIDGIEFPAKLDEKEGLDYAREFVPIFSLGSDAGTLEYWAQHHTTSLAMSQRAGFHLQYDLLKTIVRQTTEYEDTVAYYETQFTYLKDMGYLRYIKHMRMFFLVRDPPAFDGSDKGVKGIVKAAKKASWYILVLILGVIFAPYLSPILQNVLTFLTGG